MSTAGIAYCSGRYTGKLPSIGGIAAGAHKAASRRKNPLCGCGRCWCDLRRLDGTVRHGLRGHSARRRVPRTAGIDAGKTDRIGYQKEELWAIPYVSRGIAAFPKRRAPRSQMSDSGAVFARRGHLHFRRCARVRSDRGMPHGALSRGERRRSACACAAVPGSDRALDGLRFAACVQDALFPRGRGSLFGCFLHFGLHAEEKPIHGRARRRLRCVLSAQFRRNGLHRTTRGGEAYSRDKSCARRVG